MNGRFPYPAALLFALVSGAAALAHQLIWIRVMVDALGAGAGTFARVTGAFFIGLALGAWLASRWTPGRPWRAIARAEGAVAAMAAGAFFGAQWVARLSPGEGAAFALPFLLVLPPAVAMGVVLPWLVHACRADGRGAVWLYAANTAGAVAGVLGTIAVALPVFGLTAAALVASAGNLLAALLAALFGAGRMFDAGAARLPGESPLRRSLSAVAFGSGFLVLAQEVLLQHQFAQIVVNSLFSSATVLVAVLVLLAVAAALSPVLARGCGGPTNALPWALALAGFAVVAQPFLLVGMRGGLAPIALDTGAGAYAWETARLALFSTGPALLLAGLIFPLALQAGGGGVRATGMLLAWNGLGGLAGAELTNALLAPAFGLWQGMALVGCGYLALTLLVTPSRLLPAALALGLGVAALGQARLPQVGLAPDTRVLATAVGREGVVAVTERGTDDRRILFNNTYSLGGSRARFHQERQAHVPLLLHGDARRVALLGVATGSTLAGVARHVGVEEIDAIELSPLATRFAREFFAGTHNGVFDDPRVRLVHGDARFVMAQVRDRYDVVVGDLFMPWRTGEGRMFSREHFANVRRALRADGLFCQWLPLYQLTRPQCDAITRTFLEVFPNAVVVRGDFFTHQPIIALVGGRSGVDWARVAAAMERLRATNATPDPLARHADALRLLVLGVPPPPPPGPVNTLANAWLEWDAGRNIVERDAPWVTGSVFREYAAQFGDPALEPAIPAAVWSDAGADADLWPVRRSR